jgi:O-Antigen ligase
MPSSLKALIVVLAIAAVVFRLAKPLALRFSDERDFSRRRNTWFVLTIVAFVSPNFWIFALVAAPLFVWAGRKDKNPVAFYLLMMQVIPSIPLNIPLPGVNAFFDLDNYRLLSLCVLVPTAWRVRKSKDTGRIRGLKLMDLLILAYGALQVALFIPPDLPNHIILHDSFTNEIRVAFLYVIDAYILYYVVSRSCFTRQLITEAQAAFCLSCAVMAALAIFEALRHWLLYFDIAFSWNPELMGEFYKFRGGGVRAQASSGNILALAYLLAIACGFWLYLQSLVPSKLVRVGVPMLLCTGILATYSRGPWVGLAVIYVTAIALGPRAVSNLFKSAVGAMVLIIAVSFTPLADRMAGVLPFAKGSVDEQASFSISYRQRLAERSWELITEHPYLGDQLAVQKLEDMRQGEGIIDFVNTYAQVTLFYGFIGLAMFSGPILLALSKAYRMTKRMVRVDADLGLMGISLVASILCTLAMLVTCSFILGYQKLFYVIAGFAAAYANIAVSRPPEQR